MNILKFLGLQRRQLTTDELFDKCEKSFKEFCSYVHLSHTRSHFQFKYQFSNDADYCISAIVNCSDDELKRKLLNHLQTQIDYIQDNCFGVESSAEFMKFLEKNYPYNEKVDKVISDYYMEKKIVPPTINKVKMK